MLYFRREEVRGKLRETLELEERALKIVERLLEDSVTEDVLVDCVSVFLKCSHNSKSDGIQFC